MTTRQQDNKTSSKLANVKQKKKKSFTLVEIVFTIAIIGILLAIFLPAMSAIKLAAQKVKDQSNLRKIAEGWKTYTVDKNFGAFFGEHMEFVHRLSGGGPGWQGQERCIINDPYVYISSNDKYASKVAGEAISGPSGDAGAYLGAYAIVENDITTGPGIPFSYCLISGLSASIPLATTPVAFTRGLKANGKWHSKYGLYGDKGGYVVFCDGHVTWFDGDKPARFLHLNGQEYTSDIRKTIPSDAFISGGYLANPNITDSNGSPLLIQHAGAGDE
ncbi:MAG: prepilin-type N-terminal cleavage/methylation domain-containing protein [Puniceicoccales bacterium]|nr:prepilin-type N-terminal cleavage/methylation domain-containing protein [Puniceicoccales bacterium]